MLNFCLSFNQCVVEYENNEAKQMDTEDLLEVVEEVFTEFDENMKDIKELWASGKKFVEDDEVCEIEVD
jgi:hypothetical protein